MTATILIGFKNFLQGPVTGLINKKNVQIVGSIIGVLVLVFGLFWARPYFSGSRIIVGDPKSIIISGVHNVSELTTATVEVRAAIPLAEPKKIFFVPRGSTNLVYEGVGLVQAGISIKNIEVIDVNQSKGSIHIILPAPQITHVNLDVDRSSTLANYRTYTAPKPGPEHYEQAQRKVMQSIRANACSSHILEAANANAEQQIRDILSAAKFEEIIIDTQLPDENSCTLS
jgi:hypothetical protein